MNTQDLVTSYQTTLSTMGKVYPFSEFEVQPWYNKTWIAFLKDRLIPKPLKEVITQIPNPSELRSMYIMDLIDCGLIHHDPSFVHQFYLPLLSHLYPDDPFSVNKSNRHRFSKEENIEDFYFYPLLDPTVYELLSLCFSYAYAKNYDIFAGKTYECLGLFSTRKYYVYTLTKFHDLNLTFVHFTKWFNPISGGIDLFGHSTFTGLDQIALYDDTQKKFLLEVPKESLVDLKKQIKLFTQHDEQRFLLDKVVFMFKQRISRYGNLLGIVPFDSLFNGIAKPVFSKHPNPITLLKQVCLIY